MDGKVLQKVVSLIHNVRFGGLPTHYPSIAAWDPAYPDIGKYRSSWAATFNDYGDRPLGIYLNIPFCKAKCGFCFLDVCPTGGRDDTAAAAAYVKALVNETEMVARVFKGRKISHVYIGGGTPNTLSAEHLGIILKTLRGSFDLSECRQISMESNPDFFDEKKLAVLYENGVTMFLMGIQSFSAEINRANGRCQDVSRIEGAFGLIRASGIRYINADLLCGLKGQRKEDFLCDVKKLAALRPTQIHLNRIKPLSGALPRDRRLALESWQKEGLEYLRKEGYTVLDEESVCLEKVRNMQGDYRFHLDGSLIALGAGALGHAWGTLRWQNVTAPSVYTAMLANGRFPAMRGIGLTPRDELRHYLMNTLLHGINVKETEVEKKFGRENASLYLSIAEDLEKSGHLIRKDGGWFCRLGLDDWLPVTAAIYDPEHLEKIARRYKL